MTKESLPSGVVCAFSERPSRRRPAILRRILVSILWVQLQQSALVYLPPFSCSWFDPTLVEGMKFTSRSIVRDVDLRTKTDVVVLTASL